MILLVKNDSGWFDKLRHHNRQLKKINFFYDEVDFYITKRGIPVISYQ